MKLIFFDEAKNDADYSHYHLGGVCIDDSVLQNVEEQMQAISKDAFGAIELSEATEFHAAEIYHRKKNFKLWTDFNARISIIGRIACILSRKDVQLIDIQVNCSHLSPNQKPDEIAFMYLCERANDLVRAQQSIGMLIGDRESDQVAARYATTLSSYRAKGTNFAYGREIKNLVDSVHFTRAHLSRFLQLADVYVWLLQFRNRNHGSEDLRHKALFELLSHQAVDLSPSKYKEWPKT